MTDVVIQIITPYANQAGAIELSKDANGVPEGGFNALLTTDPAGGGVAPTHCWATGWLDSEIAARFEADTVNYVCTHYSNRTSRTALAVHVPPLYDWIAP